MRRLPRIVDHLGPLLEPLAGSRSPAVDGVVIYDAADDPSTASRAIVLGVGVHGLEPICRLLRSLGSCGASALVVRNPVEVGAQIRRTVQRTGVMLLGLAEGASWAQAAAMLRAVLGEDNTGEAVPELLGGMPSGDLFSLANAIAELLGAPITIEDRHSNVLAFSGRQEEADSMRIETILGRRTPDRYTSASRSHAEFDLIHRSPEPVFLAPWSLHGEQALPRAVTAVRAGGEILGSVWAAVHEPLSAERSRAFTDAAKLVALHMLRLRAGADVERRLRADLVSTVLEGGPSAFEAAGRLGVAGQPSVVLGLGVPGPRPGGDASAAEAARAADLQRAADAFALHLTALQPGSAVAMVGDVAYGIMPVRGEPDHAGDAAARVASAFLSRIGSAAHAVIGIGSLARDTPALVSSRRDADRALRVLQHEAGSRRMASIGDVHIDSLLLEIADLAAARGDTVSPPIARLLAYDVQHHAQLVLTLRCWLDAFGDVTLAARNAYVHQNTFRYRLRRAAAVSGLDLYDPRQRFAAMLQLRLLEPKGLPPQTPRSES